MSEWVACVSETNRPIRGEYPKKWKILSKHTFGFIGARQGGRGRGGGGEVTETKRNKVEKQQQQKTSFSRFAQKLTTNDVPSSSPFCVFSLPLKGFTMAPFYIFLCT